MQSEFTWLGTFVTLSSKPLIFSLQLCTDGEASQVIAAPTQGQTRNAAVVNTLYQLHLAVSKVNNIISDKYHTELDFIIINSG